MKTNILMEIDKDGKEMYLQAIYNVELEDLIMFQNPNKARKEIEKSIEEHRKIGDFPTLSVMDKSSAFNLLRYVLKNNIGRTKTYKDLLDILFFWGVEHEKKGTITKEYKFKG